MRSVIGVSILIVVMSILSVSCDSLSNVKVTGNWRMDSIYDYYNGFTFTNTNPFPKEVYEYRENQSVLRKGMGEQLEYRYALTDSILTLTDPTGNQESAFIIVYLDNNRMALKKNKKVLFPGKNQVRYEVRYFSRMDSAGLK